MEVLLSDDAPQFKLLAIEQALCWIHDGRNYKMLQPVVPVHSGKLDEFRGKYWNCYRELAECGKKSPQEKAEALSAEFNHFFKSYLTVVQTAKKLGVSAYEYIYDRVSRRFRMPSLAKLIRAKRFSVKDYDTD